MKGKETKKCEKCNKPLELSQFLIHEPEIFIVNLVWDQISPSRDEISECFSMIENEIEMRDIFSMADCEENANSKYHLCGMICYYGKHYEAYFENKESDTWWIFDDTLVKVVSNDWNSVKEHCIKGHQQPICLFFEKINSPSTKNNNIQKNHHQQM